MRERAARLMALASHPAAWPIRWRITALIVVLLTVTQIGFGGLFLLTLDGTLRAITIDHLREQARAIIGQESGLPPPGPAKPSPKPNPKPTTSPIELEALARVGDAVIRELAGPDTGVLLYDASGALVTTSSPGGRREGWPIPERDALTRALGGAETTLVARQATRRSAVLLLPLRATDDSVAGVLVLAGSLDLVEQVYRGLRIIVAVGGLLTLAIAGAIVYRATRSSLRPLERMVVATRRIGAGRLDERLRLARRDEIGELADAFDGMLDRLEAAFETQRRFVADAAHELRTPLTSVGGMVEVLELGAERGDRTTTRRMLDLMGREVERLQRLVNDLLTLSRLDDERGTTRSEPVELVALVDDVVEQARLLADGHTIHVSHDAAVTVTGDRDRLTQVLLNVLDNAIAFTPPGGAIDVRVTASADRADIAVQDTGPGLRPDDLPRIFERFFRSDRSRARSRRVQHARRGAGLGLSIAAAIAQAHGGTLTATSVFGSGTTLVLSLPLAPMLPRVPESTGVVAAGA